MNKRSHFIFFALAIGFILALGDVSALFRQETKSDEFHAGEITVNSTAARGKSTEGPIAMEVISGEELATQGKINVDDILKNVANVSIQNTSSGMRIAMARYHG